MNIILCGLPYCGKSSVGQLLAKTLNWKFIDTDDLIVKAYKLTTGQSLCCREIFKKYGENYFRELEKEQIKELKSVEHTVIATGGGSIIYKENQEILQSLGCLIYLKIEPQFLLERISTGETPAYLDESQSEESLKKLAAQRTPIYETIAHGIVNINHLKEDDIVKAILTNRNPYGE